MNRIALYICAVLVFITNLTEIGYGQVPREVPAPDMPNSIRPPADQLLRIPDSFFRHDQLPQRVRENDFVSFSEIRKEVLEKHPGRIVHVNLLVPRREGLNYLYDVRVLTEAGQVLSIKVDAKSGEIVDVRG